MNQQRLKRLARKHIAPCSGTKTVMVREGNVDDIIEVIRYADRENLDSANDFAVHLQGKDDHTTLQNVYRFVRSTVRYKQDKSRDEVIKTPGCTISDAYADCKSMTILTGALLRPLGYRFFYRVAFYDPAEPQKGHIYTVVKLPGGEEVVVDPVHSSWNTEDRYFLKKDYAPAGGSALSGLSGGGVGNWLFPIGLGVLAIIIATTYD